MKTIKADTICRLCCVMLLLVSFFLRTASPHWAKISFYLILFTNSIPSITTFAAETREAGKPVWHSIYFFDLFLISCAAITILQELSLLAI